MERDRAPNRNRRYKEGNSTEFNIFREHQLRQGISQAEFETVLREVL